MLFFKILMITLILDLFFLMLISKKISTIISNIQGSELKLNVIYALLVYLFVCVQIYSFIIVPKASLQKAFLLGISTYAIFELTNMAIFKEWSYQMVLIDTLWGGILYSLTTYILRAFFT